MLYITMEVEPRIVKQYKCHHCFRCKNYWGKGMDGEKKKVSLRHKFVEKKHFGASYSSSDKLLLVARHILTTGLQKFL